MKALDQNQNGRQPQIGLVLLILGGLALLSNLGLFSGFGNVVGAALFAGGGAILLRLYGQRKGRTFVLIAAFALFAIAAAMIGGRLAGGLFLGTLGLGFAAVYGSYRRHWWAIIPAGVLLTLGLVAALDALLPGVGSGSVLFIGFAATFALLTRLPQYPQPWAIYPALALAVVAVLVLTTGGGWLLPLALVGAGLYLMSRRTPVRGDVPATSATKDLVPTADDAIVPAPAVGAAPVVAPAPSGTAPTAEAGANASDGARAETEVPDGDADRPSDAPPV